MADTDEAKGQLAAVKGFVAVRRGFLILLGGVGLGKSHLAVGVLRASGAGLWVKQADLLRRLRATYRDDKADDPIEPCKTASLLILDEMGVSAGGKDEGPMLYDILDHRYCAIVPTVITSNLDWETLAETLGERLADRLREATYRVLTLAGRSRRSERRKDYFA
jgi:DNA replication protein DnaC